MWNIRLSSILCVAYSANGISDDLFCSLILFIFVLIEWHNASMLNSNERLNRNSIFIGRVNKCCVITKSKTNNLSSRLFELSEMSFAPPYLYLMDWTRKEATTSIDGWKSRLTRATFLNDDMFSCIRHPARPSDWYPSSSHIHCPSSSSVVSFVMLLISKIEKEMKGTRRKPLAGELRHFILR